MLEALGAEVVEVRLPEQLADLDAIILPGGESTTLGKLLEDYGLRGPLRERIEEGLPTLATCAGLVLLARQAEGRRGPSLDTLDVTVERNAFGRQRESFEVDLAVPALGREPMHAVFIRAPAIESVGTGVQVLAELEDGRVVAVRQGHQIGVAFHPEIAGDSRLHELLLKLALAGGAC